MKVIWKLDLWHWKVLIYNNENRQLKLFSEKKINELNFPYERTFNYSEFQLNFLHFHSTDQRLIVSIYNVGGIFGAIVFAYISKKIGRKTLLKMASMLHFMAYILIAYAYNGVMIMASRFMLGMAASGITITVPLFVSEIAEDKWVISHALFLFILWLLYERC